MKTRFQALALAGLGLFLLTRYVTGVLPLYVSQNSIWLIGLAGAALVIMAAAALWGPQAHDESHAHILTFSPASLAVLLLPVLLGLVVPPRPLGASALANREVNFGSAGALPSLSSSAPPSITREKSILDWLIEFQQAGNPEVFNGQAVRVVGFVYRDDRFGANELMVSRFVVRCCIADATAVGLIVRWPVGSTIGLNQWIEAQGHFEAGEWGATRTPILIAETVIPVDPPDQPYLNP